MSAVTAAHSLFDVQLPKESIFLATEHDIPELLLSPSVHKGFYLYLRPLALGAHTVEWTATWDCPQFDLSERSKNVRYNLIVRSDPKLKQSGTQRAPTIRLGFGEVEVRGLLAPVGKSVPFSSVPDASTGCDVADSENHDHGAL